MTENESILLTLEQGSSPSSKRKFAAMICFCALGFVGTLAEPAFSKPTSSGISRTVRNAGSFEAPSSAGKVVSLISASLNVRPSRGLPSAPTAVTEPLWRVGLSCHEAPIQS